MVEGAGLENRWARLGLVGSNPTLSVSFTWPTERPGGPVIKAGQPTYAPANLPGLSGYPAGRLDFPDA